MLQPAQLLLSSFKLTTTFERWLAALFKDGHQPDKACGRGRDPPSRAQEMQEIVDKEVKEEATEDSVDPSTLSEADRIRYQYRKHMREQKQKERFGGCCS